MKKIFLFCLISLAALNACEKDEPPKSPSHVTAYLDEILTIMEANSINREKIDWKEFKEQVWQVAGNAQDYTETYPAIKHALYLLDDGHSFFITAGGTYLRAGNQLPVSVKAAALSIPDDIGYVRIKSFGGSSDSQAGIEYAQDIVDQIKAKDKESTMGWLVDLRGNGGGNMWPMLAGIGPLLGNDTLGYFKNVDGYWYPWSYSDGVVMNSGYPLMTLPEPYRMTHPPQKVAVLLDKKVASSGEAVAIAFVGRPHTKSFGEATYGVSTANRGFEISNGSILVLTVAYMADRNRKVYGIPVEPDYYTTKPVEEAIGWIRE